MKQKPYSEKNHITCKDTGEKCTGKNYLNTEHWKNLRKTIYDMRKGECERCHSPFPIEKMVLHHNTYKRIGNENPADINLLCVRCHKILHKARKDQHADNRNIMAFYSKLTR